MSRRGRVATKITIMGEEMIMDGGAGHETSRYLALVPARNQPSRLAGDCGYQLSSAADRGGFLAGWA